jgi:hypothetical protein
MPAAMQKKLFELLKRNPFFILLLPFFFVLHGYRENLGFIGIIDLLVLLLFYSIAALVVYGLFFFLYRNRIKASLVAIYLLFIFLFFGALQDFLQGHIHFAARYRVLLPLLFLLLLVLLVYLRRTRHAFNKLVLFLNILLVIYIVVELTGLTVKKMHPPANPLSVYPFLNKRLYGSVGATAKPDIYFLIFDEYASSLSLKENYNFSNSLDTFLLNRGFSLQQKAYSNYHFTWMV